MQWAENVAKYTNTPSLAGIAVSKCRHSRPKFCASQESQHRAHVCMRKVCERVKADETGKKLVDFFYKKIGRFVYVMSAPSKWTPRPGVHGNVGQSTNDRGRSCDLFNKLYKEVAVATSECKPNATGETIHRDEKKNLKMQHMAHTEKQPKNCPRKATWRGVKQA